MSTRYYPLYQRGNPRLRVFLPNFWMKLIRSEEPLPPNVVLFQTSIEMTKYDIKNYLEKIYKVPVVDVKETIKMGKVWTVGRFGKLNKEDDYKEALVYLPKDYNFEFPEFGRAREGEDIQTFKKMREELKESQKGKVPYFPSWFVKPQGVVTCVVHEDSNGFRCCTLVCCSGYDKSSWTSQTNRAPILVQ